MAAADAPLPSPAPAGEMKRVLREALGKITEALERADLDAAVTAMKTANEACAELSGRGVPLDRSELPSFQALAIACGEAMEKTGRELHAASNRRENIRRGMNAYLRGDE